MFNKVLLLLVGVLLTGWSILYADEPVPDSAAEPKEMTVEEFVASLTFQQGKIELPGGIATLNLPESFRYLDPADTERVLVQAWGNPSGKGTLGMLVPTDVGVVAQNSWAVVIHYEEDGHVSDDDADSIDYDDLLQSMQEKVAEESKERLAKGYEAIKLVNWAAKPHYDKAAHKLYWAKEIAFGEDPEHTLNYNIRVLGRKGVLVLNAVSAMTQLGMVEREMAQVLSFTDFNSGNRYADFDSRQDKTAAYGLAALVAGGVAAKAGLFGKLFAVLLAAKKLVIAGVIGIGAFLTKLFRKKG